MSRPATMYINRRLTSFHQVREVFDLARSLSVTKDYTVNATILFKYLENDEEAELKITSNNITSSEFDTLKCMTRTNLIWRTRCTVEIVFELIASTLKFVKSIRDEEEFLKVIHSMKQYVENGHTVDIIHFYNFRNGEGATIKKNTSYRLEAGGLPMMRRTAVRNNLKKTQCHLAMMINIKFT